MSQLTLVSHHLCPYVQRAAIALLEKGVPFERVMVDLSDKPAWFSAISPLGKVPLLQVTHPDGTMRGAVRECGHLRVPRRNPGRPTAASG